MANPTNRKRDSEKSISHINLKGRTFALRDEEARKASTLTSVYGGNQKKYSDWTITATVEGIDPSDVSVNWGDPAETYGYEAWYFAVPNGWVWTGDTNPDATSLELDGFAAVRTANAVVGYQLGEQSDKKLATQEQGARADTALQPVSGGTEGHLAGIDANGRMTDSGKGASDFMASDAKIQRIYNTAGTDALDDKGSLYKSAIQPSKWVMSGADYSYSPSTYSPTNTYDNQFFYETGWYAQGKIVYNSDTGGIYFVNRDGVSKTIGSTTKGLNPFEGDVLPNITGVTLLLVGNNQTVDIAFSPKQVDLESTPYAHLALETIPDREYSNTSTYAVGDLVKYGNPAKAYRCNTAISTPENWNSAHWTEIPVLMQKVDKPASPLTPATKCKVTYDENGFVTAGANLEPEDVPALPYMPTGAHVRRVWADDDSSTVDAEGVMRGTSLAVSKWTRVGGGSTEVMDFLALSNGNYYWGSWYSGMLYTPSDGKLYWRYGSSWPDKTEIKQDLAGKDPTLDSCTFDTFTADISGTAYKFTFTPAQLVETEGMIARFALESLPNSAYSAESTYAVGDLVKYRATENDPYKAYRCNTAITTAENWTAAHWTEIPVLAQKQDALTFDSTPTAGSTNPVTSGGVKTAIDNIKVQKVYNAAGDEATDDKGQMFRSAIETGGHWEVDVTPNGGVTTHDVYMLSFNETNYAGWRGSSYKIDYNKRSGALVWWERVTLSPSISGGLNPTDPSQSRQMAGTYTGSGSGYTITATYVAQGSQLQTTPSDFLVRVSDLAAFDSTKSYSVGDIVGYQGMVYKCTTAHSAAAWDASHFTLASKAEVQAYLAGVVATGGGTPLAGNTYDFSLNADIVKAVADMARALGATVNNDPTESSES